MTEQTSAEYRALSTLAVVGLCAGVASLLALATMEPALAVLPAAGILLSGAALVRIDRSGGGLIGRKGAVAGLLLSAVCFSVVVSHWWVHRWLVRCEARQFADAWFEYLRRDEPHKAEQLTRNPEHRKPFDGRLWDFYRHDPEAMKALDAFVAAKEVRTVLALGHKAQVRYYESENQSSEGPADRLSLVYAVSFDDAGKKKTFFVRLRLERFHYATTGRGDWTVLDSDGGITPWALGG